MKKKIPASIVAPGHPDFVVLDKILKDIQERAGGPDGLESRIPAMLRREIDWVIKTATTRRRSYAQLEKVERTYIGTLVEIMLRAELNLPRGRLDTVLCGHDVDIKHTMSSGWMIPTEAIGHPCILSAADEKTALCYLGLVIARPEYLRQGQNKDKKTSLRAEAWENILWIFKQLPYPPNFWRSLSDDEVDHIFAGKHGNERMKRLFRATLNMPVTREAVQGVGQQKDFMRRVRADGGRGTRDILRNEGILILSKEYDRKLMTALGLPIADFVPFRPSTQAEKDLAEKYGRPI
ncbi:NaeI family type II restriction endonuclease [Futiania mangrovi]|uniref:Type II restriction enzyme NaeI domain-containing protein n=1 Tax=Futiania mangrovi TaxID=2959716 RepID=A0A9J6P7T7_9PROT|nr:NaeI family type II restriction endonuclease [Futiania mangrovii]MCP1335164.1 hypothetical protein [Futiania mangrovii]